MWWHNETLICKTSADIQESNKGDEETVRGVMGDD